MCLLIFSPDIKKSTISMEDLKRGFEKNDDGAGLAYIKNRRVIIDKGYFKFESFKNAYERIVRSIEGPLMIHFRMATSGKMDHANSHPMSIFDGTLCMGHNGVFSELSYKDSAISDTVRLANLLRDIGWEFPYNAHQEKMIELICGSYNKLVFLDNMGRYIIINEAAGTWRNETWYSNTMSFGYTPYVSPHNQSHNHGFGSEDWTSRDYDTMTAEEIAEFISPSDNAPIPTTVNKEFTIIPKDKDDKADQDAIIDRYMEKYPNLFAPNFKAKRLARMKASMVLKQPPLLLEDRSVSDQRTTNPTTDVIGNVIPMHDPSSVFFRG